MKKVNNIFFIASCFTIFSSCGGDHAARNLGDTSKNAYQVPHDTTRADSTGADSSSTDNSGSGGTKIPKPDTAKKK